MKLIARVEGIGLGIGEGLEIVMPRRIIGVEVVKGILEATGMTLESEPEDGETDLLTLGEKADGMIVERGL